MTSYSGCGLPHAKDAQDKKGTKAREDNQSIRLTLGYPVYISGRLSPSSPADGSRERRTSVRRGVEWDARLFAGGQPANV